MPRSTSTTLSTRLCCALIALCSFVTPVAAKLACEPLTERAEIPPAVFEDGLLFRISRDGQPDSFLFGTIHISDPKVMNFAPAIQRAYEASDQFVMEVVLDPEAIQVMQHSMFFHEGQTLSHQTGDELFLALASLAPKHGIPTELVDLMRPWAIYLTLSVPPGGGIPMDMALMLEAQKDGKPIYGLESVEEQTAVLGDLPMADQITLLTQTVCHYDTLQSETQAMIDVYRARDLAGLMAESMRYAVGDTRIDNAVFEALIWRRNQTMFDRLEPIMKRGSAFVAVGALHLPGKRGLLNLLKSAGYEVQKLY